MMLITWPGLPVNTIPDPPLARTASLWRIHA
jgi:hypothetical protein